MGRPAPWSGAPRAGGAADKERSYYEAKAAFVKAFSTALHPSGARPPQPPPAAHGPQLTHSSSSSLDPLEASLIAPGLFLGSREVERSSDLLARFSISHVLQVGTELAPSHADSGISYLSLPIYDIEEEDVVALLPACLSFLEQALSTGGAVLVHCVAGVSRSAAVVMAQVMWTQGVTFAEARAIVKAARPRVNLNLGFTLQLQLFEKLGLSGLVQWGRSASLPASLAACWTPWDLERFLEVKAQVADDRTVQGGGGGSGTAAAALELEELDQEQEQQEEGAGTLPLTPWQQQQAKGAGCLGQGSDSDAFCAAVDSTAAADGGLQYCNALEVAVRAGRIAWSDYYLGEQPEGEPEAGSDEELRGPPGRSVCSELPYVGCGEEASVFPGTAGAAWFPDGAGAVAAAVHAPSTSTCSSPHRRGFVGEPAVDAWPAGSAGPGESTLVGAGGAAVVAAPAAAGREGEEWWRAAFAPSPPLSPSTPARSVLPLLLDSPAGCEEDDGEGRPLLSRAPACLPVSPPATPPHFRPSVPGQEPGAGTEGGSLYEYAVALQQAARGGDAQLRSPGSAGRRRRPAASELSVLCESSLPGLVLPPLAGGSPCPSRPDSAQGGAGVSPRAAAGWCGKQQRPGTAQSVLSNTSFGSGRSSLSVQVMMGGGGSGLSLTRSDSCLSSASSCATLPSVRSSASSGFGGRLSDGRWGQEAAEGGGAQRAAGGGKFAVPVMPLLLPRIVADRPWCPGSASSPASACASPHSPLTHRACSSSRLGSPFCSPGPGSRQLQAAAAAELLQQRPGSPSSLLSRLDR